MLTQFLEVAAIRRDRTCLCPTGSRSRAPTSAPRGGRTPPRHCTSSRPTGSRSRAHLHIGWPPNAAYAMSTVPRKISPRATPSTPPAVRPRRRRAQETLVLQNTSSTQTLERAQISAFGGIVLTEILHLRPVVHRVAHALLTARRIARSAGQAGAFHSRRWRRTTTREWRRPLRAEVPPACARVSTLRVASVTITCCAACTARVCCAAALRRSEIKLSFSRTYRGTGDVFTRFLPRNPSGRRISRSRSREALRGYGLPPRALRFRHVWRDMKAATTGTGTTAATGNGTCRETITVLRVEVEASCTIGGSVVSTRRRRWGPAYIASSRDGRDTNRDIRDVHR